MSAAYPRFKKAAKNVGGTSLLQTYQDGGTLVAWFYLGSVDKGQALLLRIDDEEGDGLLGGVTVVAPRSVMSAPRGSYKWMDEAGGAHSPHYSKWKIVLAAPTVALLTNAKGSSVSGFAVAMRKVIRAALKPAHLKRHEVKKLGA